MRDNHFGSTHTVQQHALAPMLMNTDADFENIIPSRVSVRLERSPLDIIAVHCGMIHGEVGRS